MSPEVQQNEFGGSAEHRIERLIFYATRHGMLLTQFGSSLDDVRLRLRGLEEARQRSEVEDARRQEQDKALTAELKGLKEQIAAMRGVVYKAAGIIGGAVAIAIVKWMLGGGLV